MHWLLNTYIITISCRTGRPFTLLKTCSCHQWHYQHYSLLFRSMNTHLQLHKSTNVVHFPLAFLLNITHKSSEFPLLRVPYRKRWRSGKPPVKIRPSFILQLTRSGFESLQRYGCVTRVSGAVGPSWCGEFWCKSFLLLLFPLQWKYSFICIILGSVMKPLLIKNPFNWSWVQLIYWFFGD